jgi:hypothetical protein
MTRPTREAIASVRLNRLRTRVVGSAIVASFCPGGLQQRLACAVAPVGQQRIATHDELLAGERIRFLTLLPSRHDLKHIADAGSRYLKGQNSG